MAINENNQLDLTPDIKVKDLTYGTKIYSTPKLSGLLSSIAEKEITTEDVVFTDDILLAGDYTRLGNLTKELTGTAVLPARGKTVDYVLRQVFTKEISGQIETAPNVSTSLYDTYDAYEAGTMFQPTLKATFTDGKYKYGPLPNTQLSGWTMTLVDSENVITGSVGNQTYNQTTSSKNASHKFNELTAMDGMSLVLTAKAVNYSATNYANTNIGRRNSAAGFADVRISQGMTSSNKTITCYRSIFVGSTSVEDINIDNAFIHTLGKVNPLSTSVVTVKRNPGGNEIPLDEYAKSIIVAVPPGKTLEEVKLVSAANTPITDSYTYIGQMQITGENNLFPVLYKVYVYSPARIGQDEVHEIRFA